MLGCGAWALLAAGCTGGDVDPPRAAEASASESTTLESGAPSTLTIGGQAFTLTWDDDFGGTLGGGQPASFLNTANWSKENLGVNYEQQAYTNRECPDHPTNWNYCVQNGELKIRARKEPLDCVVWMQCTTSSQCGTNGTCASNGWCTYDQNKNGVPDNQECAAAPGLSNPPANGQQYTSGRINSDEKVEFRYGYIEFRARMPFADLASGTTPPNGMWPTIWMLGANTATTTGGRDDSVGWPMTGEIDIMEYTQIEENKVLYPSNGAMGLNALWRELPESGELAAAPGGWQANACSAWPNNGDSKCDGDVGGSRVTWNSRTIDYHQWHTWGFLWDENGFKVYIDTMPQAGGSPVATFSTGDGATEFRQPMYLLLNNAVGGELGCLGWESRSCTSSAQCANNAACVSGKCQEGPGTCINVDWANQGDKATLEVDYIRWYHRNSGYAQAVAAPCQDGDGNGTPDNIIRNCGFNEDYTYHRSDLFFEGGGGLTDINNEGGTHGYVQWVRIDNSGNQPYSVQVRQEGLPLTAGTAYKWKVDLKASAARVVPIKIAQAHDPYSVVTTYNCNVTTAWTTCSPPNFTPTSSDTYKFEIDLGTNGSTRYDTTQAYVDNMYLATTTNACQPECTGKLCGSDGCGGTCGTCRSGLTCGSWGQCVASGTGGGTGTGGTGTPVHLEAENATLTGCSAESGGDSGGKVVSFEGGDSICWSNVTLTNLKTLTAHVGAPYANGQAQVKFNNTLLGTITLATATGGWSSPQLTDISTTLTSATGSGTLCLVGVTHPNGWDFSVDYVNVK